MRSVMFLLVAAASAASAAPPDIVSQASGAALQADVRRALDLLQGVDPASLPPKDAQFVTCMRSRFAAPVAVKASSPEFADRALAAYQAYWQGALTRPESRDAEQRKLEAALRKMLGAPKTADMDALETRLEKRLSASGWHSLQGRTGLLRELMLWNKQDEKLVPVQLPEGEYRVKVVLLDGFKSFGWSHYATCGRRAAGGWTTDEALFAVVPRYDSLDDEEFRVTFLGHEAQHFADKSRFKDLQPWEFEYRAKLTELALADKTRAKVLGKFIEDQGDDPGSPHSYADRKLLTGLVARLALQSAEELTMVELPRLQSAAREMLLEDSRQRVAAGQLKSTPD